MKTELVYGLESAQLNDSMQTYVVRFQLKCLSQKLNLEHIDIRRENTNEEDIRKQTNK